jgi:hypothetical protein
VQGQLRGLQEHGRGEQYRGNLHVGTGSAVQCDQPGEGRQPEGVPAPVKQHRGAEQARLGEAAGEEFLAGRDAGRRPVAVMGQERMQRDTAGGPGEHQHREIARRDHRTYASERQQQRAHEAPLTGFSGEIAARVAGDDPAEKGDQGHDRRRRTVVRTDRACREQVAQVPDQCHTECRARGARERLPERAARQRRRHRRAEQVQQRDEPSGPVRVMRHAFSRVYGDATQYLCIPIRCKIE